jgi:hypothetical protein
VFDGLFVDRARVHALVIIGVLLRCTRSSLFSGRALGEDFDVGEGVEEVFALGVLNVTLRLVPGGTLKDQTVDPAAFGGLSDVAAFNASIISNDGVPGVGNFGPLLDSVESPVLSSVRASNLLADRGKETLGVEESSEPVGDGSVFADPGEELVVAVLERREPASKSRENPRDLGTRWVASLQNRHYQLFTWISKDRPISYWLTGFFNPQGFLTSVRQEITRSHRAENWALDAVEQRAEVADPRNTIIADDARIEGRNIAEPAEGCWIHGLVLEGASWNKPQRYIEDTKGKDLFYAFPNIKIFAECPSAEQRGPGAPKKNPNDDKSMYPCPVYK